MRLFAVLLSGLFLGTALPLRADFTTAIAGNDPRMQKAIHTARQSLPGMLATHLPAGSVSAPDFTLKISLPVSSDSAQLLGVTDEAIWVEEIAQKGNAFTARLANEPDFMSGLYLGDPVSFTRDQIIDWSLQASDGLLYGNFTTRALLSHRTPEEAAVLRQMLSANPIPD
ncbi:DUF2314 domain-containing protein [Phaeovulum sp. W22_SRMD_FR3]